jgi:hypothetical protein
VDFYHSLGYFTGLLLITPGMQPATLLRTAVLVHFLDAILCLVVAAHNGRGKILWTISGLIFGIWALGTLFLLPDKKRSSAAIQGSRACPRPDRGFKIQS